MNHSFLFALVLALATTSSAHDYARQNSSCSPDFIVPHNVTILSTTHYTTGAFNLSGVLNSIPYCEVYAAVHYGNNDSLLFATWLPDDGYYHDRFLAVGNGGMAGVIDHENMLTQLNSGMGFAVAGGDAGHLALNNNFGVGAPGVYLPYLHDEAQTSAWIHDAISLFAPTAKDLIDQYYHKRPGYSYFAGCSTGGAQGFALAQLYPTLFDGIYAGSPGNWYSHLALSFLWNAQHTNTIETSLTQAELNFITEKALGACDENDGVKDGLIENPHQCEFDIESLACNNTLNGTSGIEVTCLDPQKIVAAQSIYAGPTRADNGSQLYPGFSVGSEIQWAIQEGPLAAIFSIPILQNLVYNNLAYDSNTFNWASDVAAVDAKAGKLIDEISPDLSNFKNHGGKMLTTQGWTDPLNVATWPLEHLEQLEGSTANVSDFYGLFMVPGGGHCGAANYYPSVPATYHVIPALVSWVEKGIKPHSIESSNPPDGTNRTRKLCSWPATAKYLSGDINDWQSYTCR